MMRKWELIVHKLQEGKFSSKLVELAKAFDEYLIRYGYYTLSWKSNYEEIKAMTIKMIAVNAIYCTACAVNKNHCWSCGFGKKFIICAHELSQYQEFMALYRKEKQNKLEANIHRRLSEEIKRDERQHTT